MNVSWNQNLSSLLFQNISNSNSSDIWKNAVTSSTSDSASASDSVQISRQAINALLAADKQGQSDTSTRSSDFEQMIEEALDKLVSSDAITQEQEDAVKEALTNACQNATPPPPPPQGDFAQVLNDSLESLVSAGTISADQATAVANAMQPAESNRTSTSQNPFEEILDDLISTGTITQDQGDAIKDSLSVSLQKAPPPPPPPQGGHKESIDETLSSLVASGILTEDEKSLITETLESLEDESSDSFTSIFEEELDELVKAKIINEDQETDIQNAFKVAMQAYQTQLYNV